MKTEQPGSLPPAAQRVARVNLLARCLTSAESAFHDITLGQVDAVLDRSGNTYLLRAAQQHLHRNESRLKALFDSASDVITVLSFTGKVGYQNAAAIRAWGRDAAALIGCSFFEFIHPEDLLGFRLALSEAIQKLRPVTLAEFRFRAGDGSWCRLEATFSLWESPGEPGIILVSRDTEHRRVAREESAQREVAFGLASLAKDRFLAMLSHELRTPLTPALFAVGELLRGECSEDARPMLLMIQRNIELQSRLLEELIEFTTVGQHKVRLQCEALDAHRAIGFVLEICRGEIAAARIEVLLDLQARERTVSADSAKLQQVMWNLVKNAVKFSAPGSVIGIASANDPSGDLLIEFTDHGIGIEPVLLPLVFDPFQQGDRESRQQHGGLGLGMFIAKGLAEAQGGTLTVASEGRGFGTTFLLRLPTVSAVH